MAAQSVRDVLKRLRLVHLSLSTTYDDYHATVTDERVRTALRCMSQHELQIERWLADHERHTDAGVLNTWIQFAPGFALDRLHIQMKIDPEIGIDDLLDKAMVQDQDLLALYRRLADSVSAARVREMFENLHELVKSKDLQFTRTAVEISDE